MFKLQKSVDEKKQQVPTRMNETNTQTFEHWSFCPFMYGIQFQLFIFQQSAFDRKKRFKHPFKIGHRTNVINGWNYKRLLQKLHNHVNVFISISVNILLHPIWCSFIHNGKVK